MNYKITNARKTDYAVLKDFFKDNYKFNPLLTKDDYLDWQFSGPGAPDGEDRNIFLLESNGRLNGCLGFIPVKVRSGTRIFTGALTINWLALNTDGSGLVMMYKLLEKYQFLLHLGSSKDSKKIFRALKINMLDRLHRWFAFPEPELALRYFLGVPHNDQQIIFSSSQKLKAFASLDTGRVKHCAQLSEGANFTFDHFPGIDSYIVRDKEYLDWRYMKIPHHSYQLLTSETNHFAVYRVESVMNTDFVVIRILDWSFTSDECADAVHAMINNLDHRKCILIDFFCSSSLLGAALESNGFLHSEALDSEIPDQFRPTNLSDGISFFIQQSSSSACNIESMFHNWYITKGDGDQDRLKK